MITTLASFSTAAMIVLTLGVILCLFVVYFRAAHESVLSRKAKSLSKEPVPFSFRMKRHPMTKKDRLPVILITAIYLAVALVNLGSTTNPQTFAHFTQEEDTVVLDLGQETEISDIWYYAGLYSGGSFSISYSSDWESWQFANDTATVTQTYSDLFKWKDLALQEPFTARYVAVIFYDGTDLAMGELALFDGAGNLIDLSQASSDYPLAPCLTDEQDTVPETISFMNSTYFDEVYHPRTAYEHLNNVYPYEVSHPPLGKLIQSIGIALFGMTPFGWRIMGTLFGAAMLPILYVFLKNLFGKTPIAVCGTLLFAFDFMHFAQTRIATIDTYSVFFVLLSYFFLYRYFTAPRGATHMEQFRAELIPLGLCGLFFGIGAACKWTVIYGGLGLCILYFWNLILRWRRREKGDDFYRWLVLTLLWSVVFFLVIPGIIYTLSYLPYARASGNSVIQEMVDNQVFMFTYHNGVDQDHPYASRWWKWVLNLRPILYYLQYNADGTKACIASFGNPMVVWGGLVSLVTLAISAIRKKSGLAVFLLVGWAVNLAPWIIIGRTEFEYHYFGCILFLSIAVTYVMDRVWSLTDGRGRWAVYTFTGYALVLFVLFYPVLSGLTVPTNYCLLFLKWLPSWPFG